MSYPTTASILLAAVSVSLFALRSSCCQEPTRATDVPAMLFERVFGYQVVIDPAFHHEVVSSTPGLRHYRDTNGDSRPDEVWFIDLAQRHPEKSRPLLVRVIDEDSDLTEGAEPDFDSDLYVADWKADGTVDCVLDYTDIDSDNDVDEMGIYFYGPWEGYFQEPTLRVWWGRDIGDDNLLWYDVGYNYDQQLCEYRSHFGGDEIFVCFALPLSAPEWIPFSENPFVFLDHDRDGATEEVVRFCGIDRDIENIRHSLDADNDSCETNPRDYDVSISGWAPGSRFVDGSMGPGRSLLKFDESFAETITLRGIKTGPFVAHHRALDLIPRLSWIRRQLAWDELDHNVDQQNHVSDYERWEGVISAGTGVFPQIGGPHCGLVNVRYEVDVDPATGSLVYFHPVDNRIHLLGADQAWIDIDTDLDGAADMRYNMRDSDSDGKIDSWSIDLNRDGTADDSWAADPSLSIEDVPYTWGSVHSLALRKRSALESSFFLERVLSGAVDGLDDATPAVAPGVQMLFPFSSDPGRTPAELRTKLLTSDESLAFMLAVSSDVSICRLKRLHSASTFWSEFGRARGTGNIERMALLLRNEFSLPQLSYDFSSWKQGLVVEQSKRVAWNDRWFPPNIGWESELAAYRSYWGQFDFFGKARAFLLYPDLTGEDYHNEQPWGVDALLVGESAGCGGVTLYLDGKAYPVRSPGGDGAITFTHRLVEETNDIVSIEIAADGIGPADTPVSLRYLCTSTAGHPETQISLSLQDATASSKLAAGLELVRMNDEAHSLDSGTGVLASWGVQSSAIGPIGMGLIFPPDQYESAAFTRESNQVIVSLSPDQPLIYYVCCDWLNGRRFNRCPSSNDWFDRVSRLASEIRSRRQEGNSP